MMIVFFTNGMDNCFNFYSSVTYLDEKDGLKKH